MHRVPWKWFTMREASSSSSPTAPSSMAHTNRAKRGLLPLRKHNNNKTVCKRQVKP